MRPRLPPSLHAANNILREAIKSTLRAFLLSVRTLYLAILVAALALPTHVWGQDKKVQYRPYTDLRTWHFGIHLGVHLQDMELLNAGPIEVADDEGNVYTSFISCDQSRWDPGFNVGVVGELRLSQWFQLRLAPAIYFGSRHVTFVNHNTAALDEGGDEQRQTQDLKSAYIMVSCDLIFAGPRVNNHRVYVMAGVSPTLNLISKASDYLRLNRGQVFLECGLGFDRYLPYFKCRPELKFMYGLGNALNTHHADELRDANMRAYTNAVTGAHTKMITLSLFFE